MGLLSLLKGDTGPAPVVDSEYLNRALSGLGGDQRLHVLDCGGGDAMTLQVLAESGAKVYFLDLPAALDSASSEGEFAAQTVDLFSATLADHPEVIFDVCLFGSLLPGLTTPQLQSFSFALEPYICRTTVGHSIFNLADPGTGYRVASPSTLHSRRGYRSTPSTFDWSLTEFNRAFTCMQVSADILRPDFTLEMLLQTA